MLVLKLATASATRGKGGVSEKERAGGEREKEKDGEKERESETIKNAFFTYDPELKNSSCIFHHFFQEFYLNVVVLLSFLPRPSHPLLVRLRWLLREKTEHTFGAL